MVGFEMMRSVGILLAILFVAGCAGTPRKTMVLKYHDFGPQAAAYQTIGMEWWQWDSHGGSEPGYRCDVKVLVYRDIPLHHVRKTYPVVKAKEQDYRYLTYARAMAYLDKHIRENAVLEVAKILRQTRARIQKELGDPDY